MQTRMRAVSRVRNILAPDLERLEDRRLLSLLSQGAGSGELPGRPADQRIVTLPRRRRRLRQIRRFRRARPV